MIAICASLQRRRPVNTTQLQQSESDMDVDQRGLYPTLLPVGSALIVGVWPVYISHGKMVSERWSQSDIYDEFQRLGDGVLATYEYQKKNDRRNSGGTLPYLIFVADAADIVRGEFLCHVEKFQVWRHIRCGKF